MKLSYDPAKRKRTLIERGIDFEDAWLVFAGTLLTQEEDRKDYGEPRYQTFGLLSERVVFIVWTPRDEARHIISMRYCHEREARYFREFAIRS